MICKRIILASLIMVCLFVFTGCQKESVKRDSAIKEKRWQVTAVKVEDSGIVLVRSGDQLDKVKLINVYLPDVSDPQYVNAKKYLEDEIFGKKLDLKPITVDGSTTICEIYLESRCINKDILEQGLAWYFPKHGNYDEWLDVFKKAQLDGKGIWSTSADEIKIPLELSKELSHKEYIEKMFGSKALAVMPFYLYHNPYNPNSSYSSSRGSSTELRNKENELRSVLGRMPRGSASFDDTAKWALEAAAIKGEINRLQRQDPNYRPDPNANLRALEFELEQQKSDSEDELRRQKSNYEWEKSKLEQEKSKLEREKRNRSLGIY